MSIYFPTFAAKFKPQDMDTILMNTAYFPPVQYMERVKACDRIIIERHENYGKQSYRNRCDIMTANGVMTLSVPVSKGDAPKTLVKDIRIDYSVNWQKLHFKGIESAYKNSPFYDYYVDDLLPFFMPPRPQYPRAPQTSGTPQTSPPRPPLGRLPAVPSGHPRPPRHHPSQTLTPPGGSPPLGAAIPPNIRGSLSFRPQPQRTGPAFQHRPRRGLLPLTSGKCHK